MSRPIQAKSLTLKYGSTLIQEDLDFEIDHQDIFAIMGPSGCGKSTLLRHMIGLLKPAAGQILINQTDLWQTKSTERRELLKQFGISYQHGALISSMTLAENIAMPINLYRQLSEQETAELVSYKLALVGLAGYEQHYPSQISGGMLKRAALARAMALDPQILFFDEPSAGLDPVSARLLDDLILQLNQTLKTTVVIVSHELASIFAIANRALFLDNQTKTMLACDSPQQLLDNCPHPRVQAFLRREAHYGSAG
jgi:phospholipid/cholesterol/gamma-HCH transport system ATP-binding protein